jgi:hypothetical protein
MKSVDVRKLKSYERLVKEMEGYVRETGDMNLNLEKFMEWRKNKDICKLGCRPSSA